MWFSFLLYPNYYITVPGGKVEDLKDCADRLLPAADKYAVDELKAVCEEVMIERLGMETLIVFLCCT